MFKGRELVNITFARLTKTNSGRSLSDTVFKTIIESTGSSKLSSTVINVSKSGSFSVGPNNMGNPGI
jgi:hypothetical protein